MRARCVVALLALSILLTSACDAQKVTVDPNIGGAKPTVESGRDPRLAQLVTYEGGYKRLHYAIEEISAQTGVRIRCGANNQDWQIRGMPLVFAVKDMPLGFPQACGRTGRRARASS